jgi:hypothetical protein
MKDERKGATRRRKKMSTRETCGGCQSINRRHEEKRRIMAPENTKNRIQ